MSQKSLATIDPNSESGTALAADLSQFGAAWETAHSGSSAPSYAVVGLIWRDTSVTPNILRYCYDPTPLWVPLLALQAAVAGRILRTDSLGVPQYATGATIQQDIGLSIGTTPLSGGTTLHAVDLGKNLQMTGSWTLTMDAAASLGAGWFVWLRNLSGTQTIDPNGAETIEGNSTAAFTVGSAAKLFTDGTSWYLQMLSTAVAVSPKAPGGYLTLASDANNPVQTADVIGGASQNLYYTPFKSDQLTLWNGTAWASSTFSQLTMAFNSNHLADTLYDAFLYNDAGTVRLVTGPAWTNSTAGSCARGTGAGTTELQRLNGFWTNKNANITLRYGSTTITTNAANSALYVGTVYMDHTAAQCTAHITWGTNRKFGVWNAYNREEIYLQGGDTVSGSWNYGTATWRASNNKPSSWSSAVFNVGSGTSCNGMTILCGLPEEGVEAQFLQSTSTAASGTFNGRVGIDLNSVTAGPTFGPQFGGNNNAANAGASLHIPPFIGINTIVSMEIWQSGATNILFFGLVSDMLLSAKYRG